MTTIIRQLHEALDAGAAGWSAQRLVPESRLSVQRDYDGTPMITDILPDAFYLALARALGEKGDGCIQFTQSGATESTFGIEDDFRFLEQLAQRVGGRCCTTPFLSAISTRSRIEPSLIGSPKPIGKASGCLGKR